MVNGLRALATLLLLYSIKVSAQDWPAQEWPRDIQAPGPALQALEDYAFVPRDEATREGMRTDALLVIRDGQLVYERYVAPYTAGTAHLTWSISKSLMATVLGVAYGEGRFHLQDPVAMFYPPFRAHPKVKLEDLLHWASGIEWRETYEYAPLKSSVVAMLYTRGRKDMAGFTADQAESSEPGQVFRYSSGDSNVLAAALKGIVGARQYPDYPWTALFDPLGIRSAVWETDGSGTFVASSYAYLTARDLARIGLLMQRDGRWKERQLLPKAWVDFNRQPFAHYQSAQDAVVPGGHWWLNRALAGASKPWADVPDDAFAALGHWGQALYVLPGAKLVVVRYGDDRDGVERHNELLKRVLAAFAPQTRP